MRTLSNISKIGLVIALVAGSMTIVNAAEKKNVKKMLKPNYAIKYGKAATVFSKYKFDYHPIEGFKLPSEGMGPVGKKQRNPMNLEINEHGTIVTDHNTKLMWPTRTLLVWTTLLKAEEYCSHIRTGGYDDWRLPTIKELISVADYNTYEPTFSRKYFPGVPVMPSGYWALPRYSGGHSTGAWHIGFDGHIMGQPEDATKLTRCVRNDGLGGFDKNLFKDNKDGTVTDDATALIWQQKDDNVGRNYKDANKYCRNLELGGRDDWRLPHLKELSSVANYNKNYPAIDEEFFPDTKEEFYWTSTLDAAYRTHSISGMVSKKDDIPFAWAGEFLVGSLWRYRTTNEYYVRCVTEKN